MLGETTEHYSSSILPYFAARSGPRRSSLW
jgi:hypothetical protein